MYDALKSFTSVLYLGSHFMNCKANMFQGKHHFYVVCSYPTRDDTSRKVFHWQFVSGDTEK